MKTLKTVTTTKEITECDGCDYVMTDEDAEECTELTIPWNDGVVLEFHFHSPISGRNDCFRYWSSNSYIMKRALQARELSESEIDDFMETHLFRPLGAKVAK